MRRLTVKSNKNIEIELLKLLNTTGLTQKRVLVRKKGGASFWSTRWVQTDKTAKETVEALGYEFIAEGGDEPDIVTPVIDIDALVIEARKAGEAAFKSGLPSLPMDDPKMVNILSDKGIKMPERVKIFESWAKAWHKANLNQPIPGVFDEPEPEPRKPTGVMNVEGWGNVGTVKVGDLKPGDIDVLDGGLERKVIVVKTDVNAPVPSKTVLFAGIGDGPSEVVTLRNNLDVPLKEYIGVDNFDTMPDVESKQVTVQDVMEPAYNAGADAFKRGITIKGGADDKKMVDILMSISHVANYEQLMVMRRWIDGWQDASVAVKGDTKSTPDTKSTKPDYAFAGTPLADRIDTTSRMRVTGVGKTPAITVGNVQIGDRLQFTEGVYRVKGVIVKGASSTMIFEETDDKGNNLELKKQNRSWMAVEKSQLTPGGYVPSRRVNDPGVPHWARTKETTSEFDRKITTFSSVGYTPVKTLIDGIERLRNDFIKVDAGTNSKTAGINLDGLKVSGVNSIIKGFEKVLGKHNIKLNYIGWNPRKQSAVAYYCPGSHNAIEFQKTATKNINSRRNKSTRNFIMNKETKIANFEQHLTYPEMRLGDHERIKNNIERLKKCERWTVDVSLDDMLAGTAAHEANHAVYFVYNLKDEWDRNIRRLVGNKKNVDIKCSSVSEYGMSSMTELFAEVGVAVAFDIEIDSDVKQAYLDTIGSIK